MITPIPIVDGATLTNATATYYTVPVYAKNVTVKELEVYNSDTVPRNFTLYFVPTGQTATLPYQMFGDMVIQAGETKIFGLTKVMAASSTIQAKASANSVMSMSVSGMINT